MRMGVKFIKNIKNLDSYELSSVVFNFIDMLSHSKNDSKILKNLVYDEKSFRSFTYPGSKTHHLMNY